MPPLIPPNSEGRDEDPREGESSRVMGADWVELMQFAAGPAASAGNGHDPTGVSANSIQDLDGSRQGGSGGSFFCINVSRRWD